MLNECDKSSLAKMWLDPIPTVLRDRARGAVESKNATAFLATAANDYGLDLVWHNLSTLLRIGIYEAALVQAFVSPRINNSRWPLPALRLMFSLGNRTRLRAVGDPLPRPGPFTVFRGVAGHGAARKIGGLSWTSSIDEATWFAYRFYDLDKGIAWDPWCENPAVFCASVRERDVLVYLNESGREEEFIVSLPESYRTIRVEESAERIALRAANYSRTAKTKNDVKLARAAG